ncbi:MAG: hypothetical protein QOF14_5469 [Hyphomicrobiales bacterium]|jgi:hypothetical protein|nr:hypothetical protein [Hyphomicrobiales bacterium]
MTDGPPIPLFTGGELALADTVILLMKVMSMHGIIDEAGIVAVFADLERRYRGQDFHSAAAMAEYLRQHTIEAADHDMAAGSRPVAEAPGEPA